MEAPDGVELLLVPGRVLRFLLVVIGVLVTLSAVGELLLHHTSEFRFRQVFIEVTNLDREQSIPMMFSTVQLLAAAALCAVMAKIHRRSGLPYSRHWVALSLVLVYLAVDEATALHERANAPLKNFFDISSGPLENAWVIPAVAAVVVVVVVFSRFVWQLPRSIRLELALAGAVFVGGAVGMEMVSGVYHQADAVAIAIPTTEEALEMVGVGILIHALLRYAATYLPTSSWRLVGDA